MSRSAADAEWFHRALDALATRLVVLSASGPAPAVAGGYAQTAAADPFGAPDALHRSAGPLGPGGGLVRDSESDPEVRGPDAEESDGPGLGADPAHTADPELWALVEAAQAGDGDAFGRIYDRYVDTVYRYIAYRVSDRGLAEDLTSETFLRALRRFSTVTYQGRDLAAFFITIARNLVFDHTKSARHRLEIVTDDRVEPDVTEDGTEEQVLAALTNRRLLEAVRQLPDEQHECIVLRFLQGLNVAETAAVMGKNEGAVKAMQHRAVKRLHALLAEELT